MINFGAFGVANVGTNLCGYSPQISDEELCARYFQLSIVSPLAIMNTMGSTLDFMPFNFATKTRNSVISALAQRLSLFSYMRACLYTIS